MSFHESAQNIRVDDGHRLVAELRNEGGDWVHAELNLDEILGNDNVTYLSILFFLYEQEWKYLRR
jgi:hypothetical protein